MSGKLSWNAMRRRNSVHNHSEIIIENDKVSKNGDGHNTSNDADDDNDPDERSRIEVTRRGEDT